METEGTYEEAIRDIAEGFGSEKMDQYIQNELATASHDAYVIGFKEGERQTRNAVLQEIEAIIGADEEPYHLFAVRPTVRQTMVVRNHLRAEQRQKLQSLRTRHEDGGSRVK